MTFSTTSRTTDPDIIYKARDLIELLSTTAVPPSMVLMTVLSCSTFLGFVLSM